jgi:pilus assembly protein Flp/PilA
MSAILKSAKTFLLDESGPTAVEYAVMLALIVVVSLAAITSLGENLNHNYDQIINAQIEAAKSSGT